MYRARTRLNNLIRRTLPKNRYPVIPKKVTSISEIDQRAYPMHHPHYSFATTPSNTTYPENTISFPVSTFKNDNPSKPSTQQAFNTLHNNFRPNQTMESSQNSTLNAT